MFKFPFVSRKEFEKLVSRYEALDLNVTRAILELQNKVGNLESTLNCRDGKHEWEYIPSERKGLTGLGNSIILQTEPHYACKHCAIKKDEWEKPQRDAAYAAAEHASKNAKKPQPKRKKGKK